MREVIAMGFELEEFGPSSRGGYSFIGSGLSRGDSKNRMFGSSLFLGVFDGRPLFAEDRREDD